MTPVHESAPATCQVSFFFSRVVFFKNVVVFFSVFFFVGSGSGLFLPGQVFFCLSGQFFSLAGLVFFAGSGFRSAGVSLCSGPDVSLQLMFHVLEFVVVHALREFNRHSSAQCPHSLSSSSP